MVAASEAKEWAAEHLVGLLASPLTPFDADGELKLDALESNVESILEVGVEGMGYGHSEPWCLSHEERRVSAETFVKAVDGRASTYIHAHDHSAPESVNLTRHAADTGADLVMLEVPYEHAKTEEMIYQYFKYVADRTDIGIIVLNTPHSGRLLTPELLDRVADLEAVCALKDGINDFELHVAITERVGDRIVCSLPREDDAIACVRDLGQQVQLGTSAVFLLQSKDWHPVREYLQLAKSGQIEKATEIYDAMAPLRQVWIDMVKPLWGDFPEHPIATQKVWMDAIGMYGGPVRPPMRNHTADERDAWTRRVQETNEQVRMHPVLANLS